MKRLALLSLLLLALSTQSCDMFRRLAGRPVSADIELKRELIEEHEAELAQTRQDSIARAEKAAADEAAARDSSAVMDTLSHMKGIFRKPSSLGGVDGTTIDRRYYIIVGAFRDVNNAERLCASIKEKGYNAAPVGFRNGFTGVGVNPCDKISEVYAAWKKVRNEKFCPSTAWILVNE